MLSLYIHIPFCKQKCDYCDFISFSDKKNSEHAKYINYLLKELSFYRNFNFDTIYIGGGTPSYLSKGLLELLFSGIDSFGFNVKEYTIEINPESFNEEKFKIMLNYGINRISIGVQSFSDKVLKSLNRPTRVRDIYNAFEVIKNNGFENFNLDLIIGIQDEKRYKYDLIKAVNLNPRHISIYMLHLSEGTKLYKKSLSGEFLQMTDRTLSSLYNYSCSYLKHIGYEHYEISNFAFPGFESLHNMKYWMYNDYIGVGLGAVSKIKDKRIRNVEKLNEYYNLIDKEKLPEKAIEVLDYKKKIKEKIMLALRTNKGINLWSLKKEIENINPLKLKDFTDFLNLLLKNNYGRLEKNRFILTEKGFLTSNYIIAEMFSFFN